MFFFNFGLEGFGGGCRPSALPWVRLCSKSRWLPYYKPEGRHVDIHCCENLCFGKPVYDHRDNSALCCGNERAAHTSLPYIQQASDAATHATCCDSDHWPLDGCRGWDVNGFSQSFEENQIRFTEVLKFWIFTLGVATCLYSPIDYHVYCCLSQFCSVSPVDAGNLHKGAKRASSWIHPSPLFVIVLRHNIFNSASV